MNAFRHGLAANIAATADDADDSFVGAMYHRLRQIEVERVKALNVYELSRSGGPSTRHEIIQRLAALKR